MGESSTAAVQTMFSPLLLQLLFPLTTFSTQLLLSANIAETSLAKFQVLASQYCRARQTEMLVASLSAVGCWI